MNPKLKEFDDWIGEKGFDPYDVIYPLFERAKERASTLSYIHENCKIPDKKIFIDSYVKVYMSENFFGVYDDRDWLLRGGKEILRKEKPDYKQFLEEISAIREQEAADLKDQLKKDELFVQLRKLNLSKEEILEELSYNPDYDNIPF